MPTNVSVEYGNAKEEYDNAVTPEAKFIALQKMQSAAPSHKGGENLRRDISKKLSLLRQDIEKKKAHDSKKGSTTSFAVKKEGIGQIVLLGLPNSGKSTLLNLLTGVGTKVADYPFTTREPAIGMMDYFGGMIQLVELPAIVEGSSSGKADGPQVLSIARNADAIIIVSNGVEGEKIVEKELLAIGISLNRKEADKIFKNSLIVNAFQEQDLEKLKESIFKLLDKILVFTKKPGTKANFDMPLGLPLHSTVKDAARYLHKDFEKNLRFARVWGSAQYPGQRVSKDYELKNRDLVEIFA
jgi:small GTP-binding protein